MEKSQAVSFIKPIMSNFTQKLRIPRAFLKHIRGDEAILRSHGKSWHVKIDGGARFKEGWKDFADDHSLTIGDFLMFKRGGHMVFDVIVFDNSACEKEYISFAGENGTDEESSQVNITKGLKKTVPLNRGGGTCSPGLVARAATSYKTQRPHFRAAIVPSNLIARLPYMNIPRKFKESNGFILKYNLILKDPMGRSWPVTIQNRPNYHNRTSICHGWNQFVVGNNLKVGDECIFEFISIEKKKNAIMNVLIFRRR